MLRDLRVADQPASAEAFIGALALVIGEEQANALREYADDGGGGGASFSLPEGFAAGDACASGEEPTPTPPPDPADPDPDPDPAPRTPDEPVASSGGRLPATGATALPTIGLVLLAASLALAAARRAHPTP